MLLAVRRGRIFFSSVSGYIKGLTLLLSLKNEENPMRVAPWNQYQSLDQEMDPELQLASQKSRLVHGCTSFVCFGRATGLESPSHLKVGLAQNQEVAPEPPNLNKSNDQTYLSDTIYDDSNMKITRLKSSLKSSNSALAPAPCGEGEGNNNEHEVLCEKENDVICQIAKRKVQWTDTTGGELFEIREFEMSEDGSDDEFDRGNDETCSCKIM